MSKIESLEFTQLESAAKSDTPLLKPNLEIIKDVMVKLQVRVGNAEISVDELMSLSEGSVVQLDCLTTAPVDLLLDGKVVARGHLVSADDNFGVQITELSD